MINELKKVFERKERIPKHKIYEITYKELEKALKIKKIHYVRVNEKKKIIIIMEDLENEER